MDVNDAAGRRHSVTSTSSWLTLPAVKLPSVTLHSTVRPHVVTLDVCYIYFDETKPLPTLLTGDNRLISSFPVYLRDTAPLLWARSARGH